MNESKIIIKSYYRLSRILNDSSIVYFCNFSKNGIECTRSYGFYVFTSLESAEKMADEIYKNFTLLFFPVEILSI